MNVSVGISQGNRVAEFARSPNFVVSGAVEVDKGSIVITEFVFG